MSGENTVSQSDSNDRTVRRRRVLKTTGAAGVAGLGALAGCSGDGGDGGGSDGGDGDGSDGGDATPTSTPTETEEDTATATEESLETMNINFPPSGPWTVAIKEMDNRGVLAENLNEAGYEPNIQYSWEGSTLFAAGQMDLVHISSLENARLGAERGIETTVVGRIATLFEGFWTRPDSPYDPAVAGSPQASMDRLVEDNATLVIGSWAGGDIPGATVAFDQFGVQFSENESDLEVITASYSAIPRLVSEGEADVGLTSPADSGVWALDGDIAPIVQFPPWFSDELGYIPPLVDITVRTSTAEEHTEGVRAVVETWNEGMSWFFENGSSVVDSEEVVTLLGRNTRRGAEYAVDWVTNSGDPRYGFSEPKLYEDTYITEDHAQRQIGFLEAVAERDLIPSGWQDYVSFRDLS